jgi:hypothetical protein
LIISAHAVTSIHFCSDWSDSFQSAVFIFPIIYFFHANFYVYKTVILYFEHTIFCILFKAGIKTIGATLNAVNRGAPLWPHQHHITQAISLSAMAYDTETCYLVLGHHANSKAKNGFKTPKDNGRAMPGFPN